MMTRAEAINRIKDHIEVHHIGEYPHIALKDALDMAISALRPVTREQVEKVWNGCAYCMDDDCSPLDWQFGLDHILPNYIFCPMCGAPMTDEAVQMVMERLEALYEQKV